ncbi:MAG TPA: peptide chain release factor N(5)-glutamine methyltransferase [Bradyrhizobium sp.]|nr:peptide chain release factor N(5)-glutamine methyltransferase [Bradyrhizobium sp.]
MNDGGTLTGQTVENVRRVLASRFRHAGIESPELDARMLVGAALGLELTGLIAAAARRLTDDDAARLEDHARRRIAGEPVARIIGTKEFWGLQLALSAATLVPRPDTETLVEAALDILRAEGRCEGPLRIADLGTGSGAILLALLSELPQAFGVGTDISPAVLHTAKANCRQLRLAERAGFVACDYASALTEAFDLIVSNPPYIRSSDIASLEIEVRDHDPRLALDGGWDGLAAYRRIAPEAARLLAPGGAVIVEVGQGQSGEVQQLLAAAGLVPAGTPRTDLAGIRRAVVARRVKP